MAKQSAFELIQSLANAKENKRESDPLLGFLDGVVPSFKTVHAEPPSLAVALQDNSNEDMWIPIPKLPGILHNSLNSPISPKSRLENEIIPTTPSENITNEEETSKSTEIKIPTSPEDLLTSSDLVTTTQDQLLQVTKKESKTDEEINENSKEIDEEKSSKRSEISTSNERILKSSREENNSEKSESQRESHRGEQFFLRKFAGEITTNDYDFLQGTPQSIYNSLPTSSVIPRPFSVKISHLEGPDETESEESFLHHACGRTISTYPILPGHLKREGSPICDTFQYRLYNHRAILAVTDGCNWGVRPRLASRTANKTFVDYLENYQGEINTVREAGHLLLRAASHAHTAIKEKAKEARMESGSTTLFGGILLELSERVTFDEFEEDAQWVFVCLNVGDCKAFCVRPSEKEVVEISIGNRANSMDATDPGGRLGGAGKPDLRNLELFCFPCKEKDILIICSDGVFDNFDPPTQGILPRDLGINVDNWEDESLDLRVTATLFTKYRLQFLKTLLFEENPIITQLSPQSIVQRLLHNSLISTRQSRKFMREHPGKRLPSNFEKYPGKMDHTTALAITVGDVSHIFNTSRGSDGCLPVAKKWTQSNERNPLFAIDAPGNRLELKCAVLLNIPLSINLYENPKEILLICETIPNCNISILADENNIYLRVIPREKLNYKKLFGDEILMFGLNELEQPIERVIPLPCEVLPSTKTVESDTRSGFIHVRITKKIIRDRGEVNWISL